MWFVYILKCEGNRYYVGQAENLTHRLIAHLSGNGSTITRKHEPTSLYYVETLPDRVSAIRRETELCRQFKREPVKLNLNSKYTGLYQKLCNFIELHGDDCWYRLRTGEITLQEEQHA